MIKKADAIAQATALKLPIRSSMSKSEILDMIVAHSTREDKTLPDGVAAATVLPNEGLPEYVDPQHDEVPDTEETPEPAPEPSGPPAGRPLTEHQKNCVVKASLVALETELRNADLPTTYRDAFQKEVDSRKSEKKMNTSMRYRIKVGGRYITKSGYRTWLQTGSFVSESGHDLDHVRSQGIILEEEPCETVLVADQLGRKHVRIL